MRTDLIREINYIKMCENIKPNFSALARTYKTSRNTVKKYYYAKEEATDHKRVYRSIFDSYEDFIRERIKAVPECTYAALLMVLKAEHPGERNSAFRVKKIGNNEKHCQVIDD